MMGARSRMILMVASCAVLLSAWAACAQDWPQWRGADRDARVSGFTAPETWPAALTEGWSTTVGTGDATPALVGDRLYVFTREGDDEVTRCLNAGDGTEMWRDAYAAPAVTGPAARHPGPRSSPAVAEGKVVTLGVTGILSCLDAATGDVVWRNDPFPGLYPRFFTASSPLISAGTAIAQVGSEDNGAIIVCDLATGEEKWRWAGEGPQYSSPMLMTVGGAEQIVALTSKSIVGVNAADGALLWQLPFVPAGRAYNAATPIIDGDRVIFTGAGRGTTAVRIVPQEGGFTVEQLWCNPDVATQFNTPVLHDGLLFGLSQSGNLFCLSADTGETKWTDAAQLDRGGFAAIVDLGSAILALPSSGEAVIFAPSADTYTELARYKVSESPTYAYPVVSRNRVFVKGEDTVTLWLIE